MTPREISQKLMDLAQEYSKYSGELAHLDKEYADYFNTNRVNFKSDSSCDRSWDSTPRGVMMRVLERKLKASDRLMSAYKTHLRLLENESKNLF